MPVFFEIIRVKSPRIKRRIISSWVRSVADSFGKQLGAVTYIFCDDEEILRINKLYLEHDYYTDIITFDYSDGNVISGDLFISLDTVKTNADLYHVDYEDELLRVIIHGILHLCGWKDKSTEEEKAMREQENRALAIYKQLCLSKENEV